MPILVPFKHQQEVLDRNPDRELLAHGTGTGKTLTALWLINKKGLPALIITKKDLEKKWARAAAAELAVPFTVVTKEEFRRDWRILPKCGTVVFDEAHYLAGMTSALSKAFLLYCRFHETPCIYLLTATPYLSTPWNIYRLAELLGRRWNYLEFRNKYFEERIVGRKLVRNHICRGCRFCWRIIYEPKEGIEPLVARLVQGLGSTVKLSDCADVPPQTHVVVPIELTAEQKKWKKEVAEPNPAVRHMRHHRIEVGHYHDEYASEHIKNNLEEKLDELALEFKKLIVVCQYRKQMEHLAAHFSAAGRKVLELHGDIHDRDAVVAAAEAADDCILIVQAACSEGWEAPTFPCMAFASMSNSFKDYSQMQGRILRINALKKNLYVYLVPAGAASQGVHESMTNKEDFNAAIYGERL